MREGLARESRENRRAVRYGEQCWDVDEYSSRGNGSYERGEEQCTKGVRVGTSKTLSEGSEPFTRDCAGRSRAGDGTGGTDQRTNPQN